MSSLRLYRGDMAAGSDVGSCDAAAVPGGFADRALLRLPAAVLVAAGLAYSITAPRHVLGGDNGEYVALYRVGGAAHPPGYPLYVLILRAFAWLPAAPAHGAALVTAAIAVVGLVFLYRACRARGASLASSALVVSVFAFSSRAWILATHAEVFALNATIAAAIVWIALADEIRHRALLLGLLAGLGLCNHHSIVLLLPIGTYGLSRQWRPGAALLGFALGLLPLAYLIYVGKNPGARFVWGELETLSGILFHLRRGQYGTTSLVLHPGSADRLGQVWLLALNLMRGLLLLPALALLGLRRPRAPSLWLAAALVLAGPAFVVLFPLSTHGLDRVIVERFHLLPQVLLAILIAPALDRITAAMRWAAIPAGALAALLSYLDVREHHRPSVELYVRNTLAIAPPNAIIVGSGDHRLGAFLYAREALVLRPDVEYIDAWLLLRPWYHRRVSARLGIELPAPVGSSLSGVGVIERLLATGRPVFVANSLFAMPYPTYPIGTLRRVLPSNAPLPPPDTLEAWNLDALRAMTFEPTVPEIGTWGGDLQRSYALPWSVLAATWEREGNKDRADACRKRAAALEPYGD